MNLTERLRERFEATQKRLQETRSYHDAARLGMLASAFKYAEKAEKFRDRKESNTRPADLLSDSQRSAIDAELRIYEVGAINIAKKLGLTKEYVTDYIKSLSEASEASTQCA